MHIVIISPEYPLTSNWGGVATHNYHIAKLYASMGHRVSVITYTAIEKQVKSYLKEGCTVYAIPLRFQSHIFHFLYTKFPFGIIHFITRRWFPISMFSLEWNLFSFLFFCRFIKDHQVDLIHTPDYHFPAWFISRAFRHIPIFINVQGPQYMYDKYEQSSADRSVKGWLERYYVMTQGTRIIACSQNIYTRLLRDIPDLSGRVVHIPNFLYPDTYKTTTPVSIHSIVYWGRLEYRKGTDALIRAFIGIAKRDRTAHLTLIGEFVEYFSSGHTYHTLDDFLDELRVEDQIRSRIHLYPRVDDRASLITLLSCVKGIAVFPSRYEPFGYVTIEAMALGYITIASSHGGGKEIISHGNNGFLCHSDETSIRKQIEKIRRLSLSQKRSIIAHAKKAVLQRYSPDSVRAQFSALLQHIDPQPLLSTRKHTV